MFIFVCVVLLINFGCYNDAIFIDPLKECNDIHSQYVLEGRVVDWYNSVQGHAWVSGCVNRSVVGDVFDPSLIVKYGYSELFLENIIWPTVPEAAATKTVYMKGVTPIGIWGGCSQLEKIEISSPTNLTMIPTDWLAGCSRLSQLIFTDLTVREVRTVLDTVSTVESVEFRGVPDIENIVWDPLFPSARGGYKWITRLDVTISVLANGSSNDTSWPEVSESFLQQMSLLPRLERIYVYHFDNLDWCASANYSSLTFPSLKVLWIPGTATTSVCFREFRVSPKLMSLVVHIDQLQFSELVSTCAAHLHVGFVETILFSRDDYLMLSDCKESPKSNITIDLQQRVQCDCRQSLWLTKALIEGLVTLPSSTCLDGSSLENQPCDWLYCDRVTCHTPCVCCADGNNSVVADCRDSLLHTIPQEVLDLNYLTELLIPYSNLTLLPENLPDSLIFFDLSGNDLLRYADSNKINSLFAVPGRVVRLSANPIVCSCDNQLVIKELQLYRKQIEDYNQIVCAGNNMKLGDVDVVEICAERDRSAIMMTLLVLALIVAVVALVLGVVFYYRRQIKIFLFARGWCLCCINEEELDADRRYDVFLSFCHDDEDFVVNELLSKLDQNYEVCVHLRNWNPGDMIPSQIWNSVEQSRRTIVVLSRNFVKSLWGVLEFRCAYVSSLTEGRVRVVMVVIDDVLEKDELQGELRAYVRLNTYVKWGDPWFWDKLRFALPHHSATQLPESQCSSERTAVNYYVNESDEVKIFALDAGGNAVNDEEIDETISNADNTTETQREVVVENITTADVLVYGADESNKMDQEQDVDEKIEHQK